MYTDISARIGVVAKNNSYCSCPLYVYYTKIFTFYGNKFIGMLNFDEFVRLNKNTG